jgi:hypothetical protein
MGINECANMPVLADSGGRHSAIPVKIFFRHLLLQCGPAV